MKKKERIILITGDSSGFGFEMVKLFINNGDKVIGVSRKAFKYEGLDHYQCDITNENELNNLINYIKDKYNSIDILINNAGLGIFGPIEETSLESVYKIFNLNFFAPFNLTKKVLPLMYLNNNGLIINISSIASIVPLPYQAFYSATKASLDSLFSSLRCEVKDFNIKIISVKPGDAKTNFTKNRSLENLDKDSKYYKTFTKVLKQIEKDETNGISSNVIAKKVYKLTFKKHPPLNKSIGAKDTFLCGIYKILPKKIATYLLYKIYAS